MQQGGKRGPQYCWLHGEAVPSNPEVSTQHMGCMSVLWSSQNQDKVQLHCSISGIPMVCLSHIWTTESQLCWQHVRSPAGMLTTLCWAVYRRRYKEMTVFWKVHVPERQDNRNAVAQERGDFSVEPQQGQDHSLHLRTYTPVPATEFCCPTAAARAVSMNFRGLKWDIFRECSTKLRWEILMLITYSAVLTYNCLVSFSTSVWHSMALGPVHPWYAVLVPTKSFYTE